MRYIHYLGIIALFASCSQTSETQNSELYILRGDTILIPENSILKTKIKVERISSEAYQTQITTSGIVKAIPNNFAQIASPFSGRITKSFVRLGQKVVKGSPIFEISSPTFNEACKVYFQTKQQMQLSEKNLKRQQDLIKNGVGVQKDLEEAEVASEMAKQDYENAIASLNVYKVDTDDIVVGQPLIVRSPIQGEVVENSIVIGQYLKEDAEPVAIVAELSKVWVVGQLKEKSISSIHEADEVEVKLPCLSDKPINGKVYHVSEMLDEETRSVKVFIECDNSARIMKPGMYVTVHFFNAKESAILIPSRSVLQMESGSFVFVQLDANNFIKRNIEVAGTDNGRVILKSGLMPNEAIISEGGFYLMEAK
ncbi:MAG: efflux RND transporter periplasmic adaptor subunit [Bacteroidales bacterium]|nr:MAG: efflux RND transporter periplasmic adaptor subunit [Bacteroidales bacterium]